MLEVKGWQPSGVEKKWIVGWITIFYSSEVPLHGKPTVTMIHCHRWVIIQRCSSLRRVLTHYVSWTFSTGAPQLDHCRRRRRRRRNRLTVDRLDMTDFGFEMFVENCKQDKHLLWDSEKRQAQLHQMNCKHLIEWKKKERGFWTKHDLESPIFSVRKNTFFKLMRNIVSSVLDFMRQSNTKQCIKMKEKCVNFVIAIPFAVTLQNKIQCN